MADNPDFPTAPQVGEQFSKSSSVPEIPSSPTRVSDLFHDAVTKPPVQVQHATAELKYDMPGPLGNAARQDALLQLPQKAQLSINTAATRALQRSIDRDKLKIQKTKELQHDFNQHNRGR